MTVQERFRYRCRTMSGTSTTKRVAFFLPSMDTGGAERVTLNLLTALADDPSIELDLVLVHRRGGYLDQVPQNVRIIDLGAARIIAGGLPLARYLRTHQPDVLLSALVTANIVAVGAAALARFKGRLVVAEHNDFETALSNATNRRAKVAPALIRRTYPRADAVIAVSRGVAKGLTSSVGLANNLVTVVPNPVITPDVRAKVSEEPDHPWFTDGGDPIILAVGRLQPQKNFPLLLKAMAVVNRSMPARLVIFGEGDEREDLQTLTAKLGLEHRVDLAGVTTNPYAAMRCAHMLVMSSKYEGLPTVLIEALFCGTAVISTDCPSGPNEILKNGTYGTLVPLDDVDTLAEAICTQLEQARSAQPDESWLPYTQDVVLEQYRRLLGV